MTKSNSNVVNIENKDGPTAPVSQGGETSQPTIPPVTRGGTSGLVDMTPVRIIQCGLRAVHRREQTASPPSRG